MRLTSAFAMLAALVLLAAGPASAQGFKFEQPGAADAAAKAEEAAKQDRIACELSTPCRAELKGKKIMLIIGEVQSNGYISAQQQNYGPHFQAINTRLRGLGLLTFTPEEIRRQIAQAEIDAYFKNDPDEALSAARRLGASFILRGLISSQAVAQHHRRRQQGHGELRLHADRRERPDHFRRQCELELVFGHRRLTHGADARERADRRSRRQALRRLLPQRRARRRGQGREEVGATHFATPIRILGRTGMSNRTSMNAFRLTLGVVARRARAAAAHAQPHVRQSVADRGQGDVAEGQRRRRPGDLPAGRVHERRARRARR